MENQIIQIGERSSDDFSSNYKELSQKGSVEVLIYTSLLSLLHLQTRLDSTSYGNITDKIYSELINRVQKFKPEMTVQSIGSFVENRFQELVPEIQMIMEGPGLSIPAKTYYLFYEHPLTDDINIQSPNILEIVPFTKVLIEVTNNALDEYELL